MQRIGILKVDVSAHKAHPTTDLVAEEAPLSLLLNSTHLVTLLCSLSQLKELVVGHLLSEGIVTDARAIQNLHFEAENHLCRVQVKPDGTLTPITNRPLSLHRRITASRSPVDYWPFPKLAERLQLRKAGAGPVIAADLVSRAVTQLNVVADTFRKTGGVHVAALYDANGGLLALAEDVGRHNAVDKVIGIRALTHSGFSRCFLALGGRLSGDLVLKAARVGIPIVASQAAAITSGIDVAAHCVITLIGFTRGKHLTIYTHPERITYEA